MRLKFEGVFELVEPKKLFCRCGRTEIIEPDPVLGVRGGMTGRIGLDFAQLYLVGTAVLGRRGIRRLRGLVGSGSGRRGQRHFDVKPGKDICSSWNVGAYRADQDFLWMCTMSEDY